MADPNGEFLNRIQELEDFGRLLNQPDQRLLLVHGRMGRGKTYLFKRLRAIARRENMYLVVVDFRRARQQKTPLDEPDEVIDRLRQRIGGAFAARMEETEDELRSRPVVYGVEPTVESAQRWSPGAGRRSPMPPPVNLTAETINIGADYVGRDKVMIQGSSVTMNPAMGRQLEQREVLTRRNTAFFEALKALLQEHERVIMFFDHFEEATGAVSRWFKAQVLEHYYEDPGRLANLWIVMIGRTVPLLNEIDEWRDVLRSMPIKPLPDKDILAFWADKHGLEKSTVRESIADAAGNTRLLFTSLKELVDSMENRQSNG